MIINTGQSDVQVIGDIKEFKTSIDPKNIEFIATLLSSNLYSNPEQSFIREIVSNAWDSHVEAGNIDTPVIIKFNKSGSTWSIAIRDFGTGLSPERFREIFCNIGSSTKRESNEFIGGFGIGRYSALACSNTVYINSYYNGTEYIYVMVKSGNSITTNLVMTQPTNEKNGVEVTIKNIYTIEPYKRALNYIVFFPNVYISGVCGNLNDIKIKKFNNFVAASIRIESKILLGNVLYPCNNNLLSKECKEFLYNIEYLGIVLKFNVGDLDITPNRENIIYNSITIKKIEDKIKDARKEIEQYIKNKVAKDYTNLYDFWKILHDIIRYNILTNEYTERRFINEGYTIKILESDVTFKGSHIAGQSLDVLNRFFNMRLPNLKGVINNEKFYQCQIPLNAKDKSITTTNNILMLRGCNRFSQVLKDWIIDNYNNFTIIGYFDKKDLDAYLCSTITDFSKNFDRSTLVDYMYDYLISKVIVIDINTDVSFLKHKESIKNNKKCINKIKNFIIYKQLEYYKQELYFKDLEDCIKYLKELKTGIILINMKENKNWSEIAKVKGYIVIRARKDIYDSIINLRPSFLVDKEYLCTEDYNIIKLHTILQTFDNDNHCPSLTESRELLSIIPKELKNKFLDIINFYYKYSNSYLYKQIARIKCSKIDSYTESVCKQFSSYFSKYRSLKEDLHIDCKDYYYPLSKVLITAAIIKNKVFRVNMRAYNDVKNDKLIRILCRK